MENISGIPQCCCTFCHKIQAGLPAPFLNESGNRNLQRYAGPSHAENIDHHITGGEMRLPFSGQADPEIANKFLELGAMCPEILEAISACTSRPHAKKITADEIARQATEAFRRYEPESEFIRTMKEKYFQKTARSNKYYVPFVCTDCTEKSKEFIKSKNLRKLKETYYSPSDYDKDKKSPGPSKISKKTTPHPRKAASEIFQRVDDESDKEDVKKSHHISRSKKPVKTREKRKQKSEEAISSKSQDFERSLKKPHENSCERCWRYASPSRSPVNKPLQRYDPNFRKAHSCSDIPASELEDIHGKHKSPCQNLQPLPPRIEEPFPSYSRTRRPGTAKRVKKMRSPVQPQRPSRVDQPREQPYNSSGTARRSERTAGSAQSRYKVQPQKFPDQPSHTTKDASQRSDFKPQAFPQRKKFPNRPQYTPAPTKRALSSQLPQGQPYFPPQQNNQPSEQRYYTPEDAAHLSDFEPLIFGQRKRPPDQPEYSPLISQEAVVSQLPQTQPYYSSQPTHFQQNFQSQPQSQQQQSRQSSRQPIIHCFTPKQYKRISEIQQAERRTLSQLQQHQNLHYAERQEPHHQQSDRSHLQEPHHQPSNRSHLQEPHHQPSNRSHLQEPHHQQSNRSHLQEPHHQPSNRSHLQEPHHQQSNRSHLQEPHHQQSNRSHLQEPLHQRSDRSHLQEPQHQPSNRSHLQEPLHQQSNRSHLQEPQHQPSNRSYLQEPHHQPSNRSHLQEPHHQQSNRSHLQEPLHQRSDRSHLQEPQHQPSNRSYLQEPHHQPSNRSYLQEPHHQPSNRSHLQEPHHQKSDRSQLQEPHHQQSDRSHLQEPHHQPSNRSHLQEPHHQLSDRNQQLKLFERNRLQLKQINECQQPQVQQFNRSLLQRLDECPEPEFQHLPQSQTQRPMPIPSNIKQEDQEAYQPQWPEDKGLPRQCMCTKIKQEIPEHLPHSQSQRPIPSNIKKEDQEAYQSQWPEGKLRPCRCKSPKIKQEIPEQLPQFQHFPQTQRQMPFPANIKQEVQHTYQPQWAEGRVRPPQFQHRRIKQEPPEQFPQYQPHRRMMSHPPNIKQEVQQTYQPQWSEGRVQPSRYQHGRIKQELPEQFPQFQPGQQIPCPPNIKQEVQHTYQPQWAEGRVRPPQFQHGRIKQEPPEQFPQYQPHRRMMSHPPHIKQEVPQTHQPQWSEEGVQPSQFQYKKIKREIPEQSPPVSRRGANVRRERSLPETKYQPPKPQISPRNIKTFKKSPPDDRSKNELTDPNYGDEYMPQKAQVKAELKSFNSSYTYSKRSPSRQPSPKQVKTLVRRGRSAGSPKNVQDDRDENALIVPDYCDEYNMPGDAEMEAEPKYFSTSQTYSRRSPTRQPSPKQMNSLEKSRRSGSPRNIQGRSPAQETYQTEKISQSKTPRKSSPTSSKQRDGAPNVPYCPCSPEAPCKPYIPEDNGPCGTESLLKLINSDLHYEAGGLADIPENNVPCRTIPFLHFLNCSLPCDLQRAPNNYEDNTRRMTVPVSNNHGKRSSKHKKSQNFSKNRFKKSENLNTSQKSAGTNFSKGDSPSEADSGSQCPEYFVTTTEMSSPENNLSMNKSTKKSLDRSRKSKSRSPKKISSPKSSPKHRNTKSTPSKSRSPKNSGKSNGRRSAGKKSPRSAEKKSPKSTEKKSPRSSDKERKQIPKISGMPLQIDQEGQFSQAQNNEIPDYGGPGEEPQIVLNGCRCGMRQSLLNPDIDIPDECLQVPGVCCHCEKEEIDLEHIKDIEVPIIEDNFLLKNRCHCLNLSQLRPEDCCPDNCDQLAHNCCYCERQENEDISCIENLNETYNFDHPPIIPPWHPDASDNVYPDYGMRDEDFVTTFDPEFFGADKSDDSFDLLTDSCDVVLQCPQLNEALQEPPRDFNRNRHRSLRDEYLRTADQREPPVSARRNYSEYVPRKYCVYYMTSDKKDNKNDVEILVEELTKKYPAENYQSTKDIEEKMKKLLECPSESMALRFQKGVVESNKNSLSSRILYF